MPRKPRVLVAGGYYHILTRGNDRKKIFRNPQDYHVFLKIIKKYLPKFKVGIVHYCLMPNHLHFLINVETTEDLPKFMQVVLQVYAHYFRKKYDSCGFIFENRYKSLWIEKEGYLLECARYIERNPLRASLTTSLFDYPYSSFAYYALAKENELINHPSPLYIELAHTVLERQKRYQEYVLKERPYEHLVDQAFRIK